MPEAKPKPVEKPKPEPKKPEEKPQEKPKPKTDNFAALLNKLKQEDQAKLKEKEAKDKTSQEENKTKSDAPYNPALPLSMSEKDAIRSQFVKCWNQSVFAGAKDPHSLAVRVRLELQADGTVLNATLAADQQSRYNSDGFFRAAADSAIRAVHECSPLKNLPPEKYETWRDMELNFDPADL